MPPNTENTQPTLDDFAEALGLPPDFCDRNVSARDKRQADRLLKRHDAHIPERRFVTGLSFAFLGFVEALAAQLGQGTPCTNALHDFPPQEQTPSGRRRNSLYVVGPERSISLRKYYNLFEPVVWDGLHRYDYPSCAPHATQAWPQHRDLLEAILSATPAARLAFARGLWNRVLELPEFLGRQDAALTPRPFSVLLDELPNTQPGEPAGALLQGLAFAYYRADAPNVTLETGKAQAGSARTGRVGDVDGWSGGELVLSIEVKDLDVTGANVTDVSSWLSNLGRWPDATAILLARSFDEEAVEWLETHQVLTLDRARMSGNVALWDVRKQEMALRELNYFLIRVQRNSKLLTRVADFCAQHGLHIGHTTPSR